MSMRANHVRVEHTRDGRVRLAFIARDGRIFNTFHIPAAEVETVATLLLPAGAIVTYPAPIADTPSEGA